MENDKDLKIELDRLTELKAGSICAREYNPHKVTGVVLRDEKGNACIVEQSAVRWIDNKDFFEYMHPSTDRYMDNNMKLMTYLVVNFINDHGCMLKSMERAIRSVGFSSKELEQIIDEAIRILNRVEKEI